MSKLMYTLMTVLVVQTLIFGQQVTKTTDGKTVLLYDDGSWLYADSVPLFDIKSTSIAKLEIPKTNPQETVISHAGYSLLYNEPHEQANWIAYDLTKEETNKLFDRTDKFIPDPKVKTGTANDKDYFGSGYDRGHLAPASDMGWSSTTMSESFYYSNISPQISSFNRGIWKKLEELVRSWAIENNTIYIVTGPVLTKGLPSIGENKVTVPNYFYKVILDYSAPGVKGIGFIIPNVGSSEPLQHYAFSIDSVEKYTGIDFFPLLPDDQEELIEKTNCIKCWTWKNTVNEKTAKDSDNKSTTSVQCNGKTKAGDQCKNKTLNESGYCYLHEDQSSSENKNTTVTPKVTEKQTGTTATGIPQYTGPRGGTYHYSKSGKKVYNKKK
jgi:endonuclease G